MHPSLLMIVAKIERPPSAREQYGKELELAGMAAVDVATESEAGRERQLWLPNSPYCCQAVRAVAKYKR